nr:acyltransferase [uncultured Desulfobulbus sp.]
MFYIKNFIRFLAFKTGKFIFLYKKICHPDGNEWAALLKERNYFYSIGNNCSILIDTNITDPKYVKIGNNCQFSVCTILGHDGSIAMINRAYKIKLDSVGKVVIKDNVFIGHGAIILPGVTIGPNAIVAAGSVVSKNVAENSIVAGVPARTIGTLHDFVEKLKIRTKQYPWNDLIQQRSGAFDESMEPELVQQRVKYFFDNEK